jgi:hypothetical protein
LREKYFLQWGMLKFANKGRFFYNKKDISKIVVLKIKMDSTCIGASSTHRLL